MSLPMLQTARLLLRPLQEDDAEGLHTAYGDADARRFLGLPGLPRRAASVSVPS
jgi:RimJ/RimL family protein N-acetyltransferase